MKQTRGLILQQLLENIDDAAFEEVFLKLEKLFKKLETEEVAYGLFNRETGEIISEASDKNFWDGALDDFLKKNKQNDLAVLGTDEIFKLKIATCFDISRMVYQFAKKEGLKMVMMFFLAESDDISHAVPLVHGGDRWMSFECFYQKVAGVKSYHNLEDVKDDYLDLFKSAGDEIAFVFSVNGKKIFANPNVSVGEIGKFLDKKRAQH